MTNPLLIVVSGLPGTGKTTLARRISRSFDIPLISKDNIKERLFDELGTKDLAWSRKLGKASINILFHLIMVQLSARKSVIAESNFKQGISCQSLKEIINKHPCDVIQLHCITDSKILFKRFLMRTDTKERHQGHSDQLTEQEMKEKDILEAQKPLKIPGRLITFDTTDLRDVDYNSILNSLREVIIPLYR